MGMIADTVNLLGCKGKDKITGFEGVVSSVGFDLYGCVQVALAPPVDKDGKLPSSIWFDVQRVDIKENERVMEVPDFKAMARKPSEFKHGPADKPQIDHAI